MVKMYFIKQNRNQKGLPEIGTSNIVATATAVTTVGDSFTPLQLKNRKCENPSLNFMFVIFCHMNIGRKNARKMLVKLSTLERDVIFNRKCGVFEWWSFVGKLFKWGSRNLRSFESRLRHGSADWVPRSIFETRRGRWGGHQPGLLVRVGGRLQVQGSTWPGKLDLWTKSHKSCRHLFRCLFRRLFRLLDMSSYWSQAPKCFIRLVYWNNRL